jgi:hypothetical protein
VSKRNIQSSICRVVIFEISSIKYGWPFRSFRDDVIVIAKIMVRLSKIPLHIGAAKECSLTID